MTQVITLTIDGFKQGGAQEVYRLIIPILVKRFKKVRLIVLNTTTLDLDLPKFENLEVFKLKANRLTKFGEYVKFRRIIRTYEDQIIISTLFISHIWTALSKINATKLIWLEQNTYHSRSLSQWKLLSLLSKRVEKVICVSRDILNISKENKLRNIILAPNPINYSNFNLNTRRTIDFVFVGRMTEQKNPYLLLKAFELIHLNEKTESVLHLIGDGPMLGEVIDYATNHGFSKNCVFHKALNINETLRILSKSKVLISTSHIEGFGLARLEALAVGCCVISTDTGGARDFLPLENNIGTVIVDFDENELAKKMLSLLNKDYWKKDTIKKRVHFASKFTATSVLDSWLN